ncbi:MAG: PDZ domain-containing protein [Magnetococcales bacterium]|nr:PDZ domain-containing protein [Magnetococcales bacterium]
MNRRIFSLLSFFIAVFLVTPAYSGGWLGVTIEPPRGVQIGEIIKGGPADIAQLQNGDLIIDIDGKPVNSILAFTREISNLGANKKIVLGIKRHGKNLHVTVTLDDSNKHLSVSQTPFFHRPPSEKPNTSFMQSPPFPAPMFGQNSIPHANKPRENSSPPSWLGIAPGVDKTGGVYVKAVAPNGPGHKAGIQTGDIIISINGQAVVSPASLVNIIGSFKPDDLVLVAITRNGKAKTLQVKMAINPQP